MKQTILSLWIVVLAIAVSNIANGQGILITGDVKSVKNGDSISVESAFINSELSRNSLNTLTDSSGKFRMHGTIYNFTSGDTLVVSVSRMGFNSKILNIPVIKSDTINLGTIVLVENTDFILDEVKITGRSDFLTKDKEKLILKVGGTLLKNSVSTIDLLRKAPGVFVDQNNAISLSGRAGVTIQINGKNTNMQSSTLTSFLNSIPSVDVERIEIVSIPSAGYDADGFGGVINIVLKQNRPEKLNASIASTTGYGNNPKNNTALTFGYTAKKLSLTSFVSAPYNRSSNSFDNNRNLGSEKIDQRGSLLNKQFDFNYRLSADLRLDSLTTIGGIFNYSHENSLTNFRSSSDLVQFKTDKLQERVNVVSQSRSWSDNFSLNVNYSRKNRKGSKLSGDIDFSTFRQSSGISNLVRQSSDEHILDQAFKTRSPTQIGIKSIRIDYSPASKSKISTSLGLKGSIVSTINDFSLDSIFQGGDFPNIYLTNNFNFNQYIWSAYTNANYTIDSKTSIYAGLRLEHTATKGILDAYEQETSNVNNYTKIFPVLALNKTINNDNQLSASYGYRINRPNYKDLNPFIFFVSKYDLSKGNPFLKPSFSHNIDITYILKNVFVFSLNYTNAKDDFRSVIIQDQNSKVAVETKTNLAKYQSYGLNTTWPFNLGKYIELFNIFNYSFNSYQSYLGDNKGSLIQFYHENTFKLSKNFSFYSSFNFASSGALGLYKVEPFYFVNLGATKIIKKQDMTIKVSIKDLFKTNKPLTVIDYSNVYQKTRNFYEGRIFQITLLLRIGGKINDTMKPTSSDEEKSRVTR